MIYLTYAEYTERGGRLDSAAFSRWIGRACAKIDSETHGRIAEFSEVPEEVKRCACDIVEIFAAHGADEREVTSHSQTVGGESESVTYADSGESGKSASIESAMLDWLLLIKTPNGVPVLYRGAR